MRVTENLIRTCLDFYAFDDATVLAELNFAEDHSDKAAHLLATAYFRSGQYSSAYHFLKNFGTRIPETKFLFARCCEQLDNLTEAEDVLLEIDTLSPSPSSQKSVESDGSITIAFAHALLGRIYSKTNRAIQATSEHRAALAKLPILFESYKAICQLGGNDDASQYFNPSTVSTALETAKSSQGDALKPMLEVNDIKRTLPVNLGSNPGLSKLSTPDIFVGATDTPPVLPQLVIPSQQNPSSSSCKTPYLNSNCIISSKLVPRAPTKNPPRTKQFDGSHNGSRVVTRQQSQRVLTQNQTKIATRRSTRLFQSSVKENENEIASMRNEKLNIARIAVVKKASRSRKLDSEKVVAMDDEGKGKRISYAQDDSGKVVPAPSVDDDTKCGVIKTVADCSSIVDGLLKFAHIEAALSKYDSQRAIELAQSLVECHRSSPLGLLSLARAYFEQANYHKADECFREMRRQFGYFIKGMEYYSTALWHLQRDTDLSALSQELTEQHRNAPESWCSAGNCFSLQKENDTAIKFFQRAIQLHPDFAYAYTLLGHEYVAIEAYEQGLQCFRAALRLQPRHYNAWYGIGLIYYKQEKLGLARLHLQRALEINPRNSVLMCHVSLVQQGLEDKRGALKLLDDALSLSPRNALCRYHRAHLLFAQDRYEESLAELNELKQLAPKEPMVYFLAGKVHKKIGQPHLALMNFSWATELDPRGEQHHPVVGDRRYDEEPVTALAAMDPDDVNDIQAMDSDDSS